jgi:hypothetical protein
MVEKGWEHTANGSPMGTEVDIQRKRQKQFSNSCHVMLLDMILRAPTSSLTRKYYGLGSQETSIPKHGRRSFDVRMGELAMYQET